MADKENVDIEKEEVEGEEVQAPEKETSTGVADIAGGMGVDLQDDHQVSMAGMFFAAVVLLISVISKGGPGKGNGYWGYGIALSVGTMFFAFMGMGYTLKPDLAESHPHAPHHLNHFLFLWNFIGACFMTFGDGPFTVTSNGYFASWGMAIFSVKALGTSVDYLASAGSMMGHLAASLLVIVAIASEGFDSNKGETIYGIILACMSAVLVMYQVKSQREGGEGLRANLRFPVWGILAIGWIVSACLLTFRGPFGVTGNGYFGVWGAAVTGVFAAMAAKAEAA